MMEENFIPIPNVLSISKTFVDCHVTYETVTNLAKMCCPQRTYSMVQSCALQALLYQMMLPVLEY